MKNNRNWLVTALLCLCLCVTASALFPLRAHAEEVISKVLTTTKYTPVALMNLNLNPAATSTSGVYIAGYNWFDADTNTIITDQYGEGVYRVEITLNTYDGFVFDPNVAAYLNNIPIDYILSPDYRSILLYRTYSAEIWAPSIVKQPQDETVDAGGIASFNATAIYTVGYQWHVYDPATRADYEASTLPYMFEGVRIGPEDSSTFTIENVPAEMDGFHVYVTFLGASWAKSNSNYALLHVRHAAPTPTPEPTPEPSPEPVETPVPTEEPVEAPEPTPEAQEHVHHFPDTWSFDDKDHWRECDCGEKIEFGAHTMEWTVRQRATKDAPGTEDGVCSVCGYTETRELPYTGLNPWLSVTLYGVGGLVGLTILVLIIDSIRRRAKARAAAPKAGAYSGRHVKK